jgi:hypothetical protein
MKKRLLIAFPLLAAMVLVSCLEELEKVDKISGSSFKPLIEFPLVNSDFSMEEFLTEGQSKAKITEQGGLLVLTYDDSVSTPPGDTFFFLPDQQSPTLAITGPDVSFPSPGGSVTITRNLTFAFNTLQGEALDSILMRTGQMVFQISSNFPANISLSVGISSLKIQGNAFQQNFTFNGPGNQGPSTDLQGSVFDLTANGTSTNTISFSITATITDTGQPINNTHSLNCSFDLIDLRFRGLFGDLGTHAFQLRADSINVDIFDNAFNGTVDLLSPSISLTMRNSFGIPLGFDIQNISAVKNTTNLALSGTAVNSPLNPYSLSAPTNSQVGRSVSSVIDINSTNSNLGQLISSLPNFLAYQFDLTLNPPPVASKNFVLDDSRLTVGVHLELPFHGRVQGLSLSKRFDFDGLGIDDVEESKIKIRTTNELPLDAQLQVYFTSATGVVIDSLFANSSILKGAPVDADGFTIGAEEVITTVDLTQDKVDRIEQAESLVITAVISTTNNGAVPVKFATIDKLKINLGLSTRIGYELK